jgi:hypothetical protein
MTTPSTPTDICNSSAVPEFTLVSPAPGATNVADSTSTLVFSGTLFNQSGATESINFGPANGSTTYSIATFNPTAGGYSVPLPTLSAKTMYYVQYDIKATDGPGVCMMGLYKGSFTTQ